MRLVEFDADGLATEPYPPIEHSRPVWSLAFTPNGDYLLTGCQDRFSRIFEVATGQIIAPPLWHGGNVTNVAISSDGRQAITACSGRSDNDLAKLQPLARLGRAPVLFGPSGPLLAFAWQKNGKLFAMTPSHAIIELESEGGAVVRTVLPQVPGMRRKFVAPHHLMSYRPEGRKMRLTDLTAGKTVFALDDIHDHNAPGIHVAGLVPIYHDRAKQLSLYSTGDRPRRVVEVAMERRASNFFVHKGPPAFGVPIVGAAVPSYQVGPTEPFVRETWFTSGTRN